jgi:hypothetical protein
MEQILLLSTATASIAFTMTKTPVFNWARSLVDGSEQLAHLWSCPYCMSHWVAALLLAIYRPMIFSGGYVDLFPELFIIVTLATFQFQVIMMGAKVMDWLTAKTDHLDRE